MEYAQMPEEGKKKDLWAFISERNMQSQRGS
jgi:hypothetical protein